MVIIENICKNNAIVDEILFLLEKPMIDHIIVKEKILELARFLESKVNTRSQICFIIKCILRNKINEEKITKKWIENCLPDYYKRKYSKRNIRQVNEGQDNYAIQRNSLLINNIHKSDDLRSLDITNNTKSDTKSAVTKEVKNGDNIHHEYNNQDLSIHKSHHNLDNEVSEISFITADKISENEIKYYIPKDKCINIFAASLYSKDSIELVFDKRNGIFQRSIPDTFKGVT